MTSIRKLRMELGSLLEYRTSLLSSPTARDRLAEMELTNSRIVAIGRVLRVANLRAKRRRMKLGSVLI